MGFAEERLVLSAGGFSWGDRAQEPVRAALLRSSLVMEFLPPPREFGLVTPIYCHYGLLDVGW